MNDIPIDVTVPASARIWNYWLGGQDNYPIDREAGDAFLKVCPGMVDIARAERAFLVDAVSFLAQERGIRQFLDIGTGMPTHNNTHQVAQSITPEAKVVYVDNDPLVLTHARALLKGTTEGETDYLDSDLHTPEDILARAAATLDFSQPVCLVLLGIIGHVADTAEAGRIVDRLTSKLVPGSYLVLCDGTNVHDPQYHRATEQWNSIDGALGYRLRSPEEITGFFEGTELVEPGVLSTPLWKGEHVDVGTPQQIDLYGGVGRIG